MTDKKYRKKNLTTINITKETRLLLAAQGHKGQTYDEILTNLIREVHPEVMKEE